MKKSTFPRVVALGLIAFPFQLHAQLLDNVESANLLAVQCAVSDGSGNGDYAEYGAKLAKTLSLLSSEKQERVFGFLPNPAGGVSLPGVSLALNGDIATAGSAITEDDSGNPVLDAIGKLNEALFGVGDVPAPIIGGTDPADSADSSPLLSVTATVSPSEVTATAAVAPTDTNMTASVPVPTSLDDGLDGLTSWLANGGQDFTEDEMEMKIAAVIDAGLLDPEGKEAGEILESLMSFSGKMNPGKANSGLGGVDEESVDMNRLERMLDWAIKSKK